MESEAPTASETLKSLRLPLDLAGAVERRAEETGLNFSDLVEAGLREQVGWPPNPMFTLIQSLTQDLRARFPGGRNFPQDITRAVFRQIQSDAALQALYAQAISGLNGAISPEARDAVHRRLGKAVKHALGAVVVGRSAELGADELVRTHALLVPASGSLKSQ